MRMKWHDLLFLHWPVDPETIESLVPDRLQVDLFDSRAWISVVPFHMSGVSPKWLPDLPWMSRFPELNVRTYVTVDGKPGVWFFTLDATNPIAVRVARALFHLNYVDARIDVSKHDNWIRYRAYRTDNKFATAEFSVDYRPIGSEYTAKRGSLEEWLTSRYCLYTCNRNGDVFRGEIDHAPWKLRDSQAVVHVNSMLEPLGIEVDREPVMVQFAKRTDVVAWGIRKIS